MSSVGMEEILEGILDAMYKVRGHLPRILFVKGPPKLGMNPAGDVLFSSPLEKWRKVQETLIDNGWEKGATGFWSKTLH